MPVAAKPQCAFRSNEYLIGFSSGDVDLLVDILHVVYMIKPGELHIIIYLIDFFLYLRMEIPEGFN